MSSQELKGHGRVAIIAVHGIADQRRSDTGQCVGLQLAAASGGRACSCDLPLAVPHADPAVAYERWDPKGWSERGHKSMQQSWRSDFLDATIGSAPGADTVRANSAAPRSAAASEADVGVRFTDYLLAKAHGRRADPKNPAKQEVVTANVSVTAVDGPRLRADVFEMFWADLSRLPGSVTRIVAELFTLVFNLSRLGVDALSLAETVTDKAAKPNELSWLAFFQRLADWSFSRVLAMLALQLVVIALVLAPALLVFGHTGVVRAIVSVLAGVGGASALVYVKHWPWRAAIPSGLLIGVAAWVFVGSSYGPMGVLALWMLLLSWTYLGFLNYCELRYRAAFGVGLLFYAVTLGCIVAFGHTAGFVAKAGWINGTLGALEAMLLLHAILWPVQALLVAATVVLSEWAQWRGRGAGRDHKQVLVTARLGLFSSIGVFLVCLMIGLLLASKGLAFLLSDEKYTPWWFESPEGTITAAQFLTDRANHHAASFSLVALLLLGLIGFVTLVFLPSVLREVRLVGITSSAALGRWLTAGYRAIERLVRIWGLLVAPCAVAVGLVLLLSQFARIGLPIDMPGLNALLRSLQATVSRWSGEWTNAMMYLIAGGAAGLLALGKVAIKQLQALRAPLDAALDVDNHFREFPRDAISRVRIFERYVALLDHVRRQGYQRVVIFAHSQGTVITADLLRYLQQRERLSVAPAAAGQIDLKALREWLDQSGLRLLTVGSPLRQLYSLRFPDLYAWSLSKDVKHSSGDPWCGPQPHELGLQSWSNLWGSGDYVGRWLWSRPDLTHPKPLQVAAERYAADSEQEGQDTLGRRWKDGCIGADAHTHYFELEQRRVGAELMALAS